MVHRTERGHLFLPTSCRLQPDRGRGGELQSGRAMAQIVVERSFSVPAVLAELQARENAVSWCLEKYGVRFLRTFFSLDRKHMVCFYDAPDAEAVRRTQREGQLPHDHIWTGTTFTAEPRPVEAEFEHVIVQRVWPTRCSPQEMSELVASSESCMGIYRAYLQHSYLSADGMRTICHFRAPDAEAVRIANQRTDSPFERAWASTIHFP